MVPGVTLGEPFKTGLNTSWAILADEKHVGIVSLFTTEEEDGFLWLACGIENPALREQGYATAGVRLVLSKLGSSDHARVRAEVRPWNLRSNMLAMRIGAIVDSEDESNIVYRLPERPS